MIGMVRVLSDQIMAANIIDLVVLSEYRGKGIAKNLWSFVFKNFPMVSGLPILLQTILAFMKNVVLR